VSKPLDERHHSFYQTKEIRGVLRKLNSYFIAEPLPKHSGVAFLYGSKGSSSSSIYCVAVTFPWGTEETHESRQQG
jgi:hypothetical protein